jgi:hypothetical protein
MFVIEVEKRRETSQNPEVVDNPSKGRIRVIFEHPLSHSEAAVIILKNSSVGRSMKRP